MSARREKRLRRLEKKVEALEKLAAYPTVIISTKERRGPPPANSLLERLGKKWRVWKFCRKYLQPGVSREEAEAAFDSWKAIREGREKPKPHYIVK